MVLLLQSVLYIHISMARGSEFAVERRDSDQEIDLLCAMHENGGKAMVNYKSVWIWPHTTVTRSSNLDCFLILTHPALEHTHTQTDRASHVAVFTSRSSHLGLDQPAGPQTRKNKMIRFVAKEFQVDTILPTPSDPRRIVVDLARLRSKQKDDNPHYSL